MIPELAFNNLVAPAVTDVRHVEDRLDALMPKTMEFAILGDRSKFASKKANLKINDMSLIALSHTPYQLDRSGCLAPEIWVPLSGRMFAYDGGSQFQYGDGRAYFCTSEIRNIRTTTTSAIGLRFNMQKLNAARAAMIGEPTAREIPSRTRLIDLEANGVNFVTLLRTMMRQIDELQANQATLERLAMDDQLYRLAAAMLEPDLLFARENVVPMRHHSQERVARLCEFLQGNLSHPISLTDMERISGLSARVLQYSFQRAFGMRPKQWLCKQRLHAARAALMRSCGQIKLTALAYEFCFPSPSVFSRAYQMEFGELPSETLAGVRKHFF